jgi:hypothetical protein
LQETETETHKQPKKRNKQGAAELYRTILRPTNIMIPVSRTWDDCRHMKLDRPKKKRNDRVVVVLHKRLSAQPPTVPKGKQTDPTMRMYHALGYAMQEKSRLSSKKRHLKNEKGMKQQRPKKETPVYHEPSMVGGVGQCLRSWSTAPKKTTLATWFHCER